MPIVVEHHSAFKRIAIVSDTERIAHAVPGDIAVFALDELEQAKQLAAGS
jgi:hypothetical protein